MKTKENINTNKVENKKSKKKKKKSKLAKVLKCILITLVISLILFSIYFAYKVQKNGGGMSGFVATTLGHDSETVVNLPEFYCLLVGMSQNLTDTIMLVKYDPKVQEASMLSIQRDTFVGTSLDRATAWSKINSLYQLDPQKLLDAVSELTGIDVKYYLTVDTSAFVTLVDTIGGVEFDVPIDMNYTDKKQDLYINLKAGYQLLDGDKAEQLVRFRHNSNGTTYPVEYGEEDLGRVKTQRAFLTALAKKMLVPSTLTKLSDLIDIVEDNIETNLNLESIIDYAPYALDFDLADLKSLTLEGTSVLANGVWVYVVDEDLRDESIKDLFGVDYIYSENGYIFENESGLSIEVLDGTAGETTYYLFLERLKELGYNVTKTGTTNTTNKTIIIQRTENISDEYVDEIKSELNIESILSGSSSDADITIILGTDCIIF